ASAHRAIATILGQGEGARGHWQNAHFVQFVQILDEYRQRKAANPDFEPTRPVLFATVRPSEHDDTVPRITEGVASRCTDLFNVGYEVLTQMRHRYFAHTEETDAQLASLSRAALALMVGVLRPLGDLITTLPIGPQHPEATAGASFELFYENDYLLPHREAAWALLEERLREAVNFCQPTQQSSDERGHPDLEHVRTALTRIADSLAGHFGDWGAVSRFATRDPAKESRAAGDAAPDRQEQTEDRASFDREIRPLFRDRDIQS